MTTLEWQDEKIWNSKSTKHFANTKKKNHRQFQHCLHLFCSIAKFFIHKIFATIKIPNGNQLYERSQRKMVDHVYTTLKYLLNGTRNWAPILWSQRRLKITFKFHHVNMISKFFEPANIISFRHSYWQVVLNKRCTIEKLSDVIFRATFILTGSTQCEQ